MWNIKFQAKYPNPLSRFQFLQNETIQMAPYNNISTTTANITNGNKNHFLQGFIVRANGSK